MSKHCSQHDLELLHLSPGILPDLEKTAIMLHLEECALCREEFENLRQFYDHLETGLEASPSERDQTFAHKLRTSSRLSLTGRKAEMGEKADSLAESLAEVIEPYRRSFIQRAARYVRVHPLRSAGIASFAAVAIALAVMTVRPAFDKNPGYVRIDEGSLIVSNNHGDELWRKHFGPGYKMPDEEFLRHVERVAAVRDVNGDGTNEIVCIFGWTGMSSPPPGSLVCYNADGSDRWKFDLHKAVTLGGVLYSDDYSFYHLETGDFTHSGRMDIVGLARHQSWNPNFVVHLDGNDGRVLGDFFHPGELRQFDHRDLDHDGVDELVFGGQNNKLEHACLAIFDPRFIAGAAPAPEGFYQAGMPSGTEKFYIMFPASDVKLVRLDVTNEVIGVRMTQDGVTEVIVNEKGPNAGTLYYYLDSAMNCVNVRPADSFTSTHELLEREGKLTEHLTGEYFEALKRGVQYWDGEKFVSTVTVNRHYLESMKSPPIP